MSAVRWVLNHTLHGLRLQTRWGQPGHVHHVLAQQWRLNAGVHDMLSIETGPNVAPVRHFCTVFPVLSHEPCVDGPVLPFIDPVPGGALPHKWDIAHLAKAANALFRGDVPCSVR